MRPVKQQRVRISKEINITRLEQPKQNDADLDTPNPPTGGSGEGRERLTLGLRFRLAMGRGSDRRVYSRSCPQHQRCLCASMHLMAHAKFRHAALYLQGLQACRNIGARFPAAKYLTLIGNDLHGWLGGPKAEQQSTTPATSQYNSTATRPVDQNAVVGLARPWLRLARPSQRTVRNIPATGIEVQNQKSSFLRQRGMPMLKQRLIMSRNCATHHTNSLVQCRLQRRSRQHCTTYSNSPHVKKT